MSAKHWGLAMVAAGAACIVGAVKMDSSSSFKNGSFILQILLGLGGAGLILVGFGVAIFG